jgi:hypothetical protein
MTNVGNAIVLNLTYVDNNRPDFVGDPTKIPKIQRIVIEKVKVEGARNAGRIIGLPDSKISEIMLRDVEIRAEIDFVIKDADTIKMLNVSRRLKSFGMPGPSDGAVEMLKAALRTATFGARREIQGHQQYFFDISEVSPYSY